MSKKVVIDPKIKDDLIWASGHFLCESFFDFADILLISRDN